MAKSAKPAFRVDDRVGYYDRQDRWQIGVVRRIEAHWSSWSDDPLIIYSVSHPASAKLLGFVADAALRPT